VRTRSLSIALAAATLLVGCAKAADPSASSTTIDQAASSASSTTLSPSSTKPTTTVASLTGTERELRIAGINGVTLAAVRLNDALLAKGGWTTNVVSAASIKLAAMPALVVTTTTSVPPTTTTPTTTTPQLAPTTTVAKAPSAPATSPPTTPAPAATKAPSSTREAQVLLSVLGSSSAPKGFSLKIIGSAGIIEVWDGEKILAKKLTGLVEYIEVSAKGASLCLRPSTDGTADKAQSSVTKDAYRNLPIGELVAPAAESGWIILLRTHEADACRLALDTLATP
jgi:hypothetical protein